MRLCGRGRLPEIENEEEIIFIEGLIFEDKFGVKTV